MFSRLRRARWWRPAVVVALLPVVVFANPTQALAAGSGPWVGVNTSADNVDCQFNIQQFGAGSSAINIGSNGYCTGGPDITPGGAGAGESGATYTISVSGVAAATGGFCSGSITGTLGQHEANGTVQTAGTITSSVLNTTAADCAVSEVCIDWTSSVLGDDCVNVALPAAEPPPITSACVYGTPTLPTQPVVRTMSVGSTSARYRLVYTLTIAGEAPPGRTWTTIPYYVEPGTGNWNNSVSGVNTTVNRLNGEVEVIGGQEIVKPKDQAPPSISHFNEHGWQFSTPITIDGIVWNSTAAGYDNYARGFAKPSSAGSDYNIPPGRTHRYGGWTDPAQCRFWVGPKVLDVAGTDGDEPSSDIGQPPVVEEPPVEEPTFEPPPDIDEPTDWLGLIWAVLRSILSAIGGLASAIVNGIVNALGSLVDAILDGLTGLFVPRDDFFEDKADQVSDAFEGSTIDNYVGVLEEMVPAGSSGCEGPSFSIGPFGASGGNSHPLDACGGAAATAATATRLAITISVGMSAAFACIRILGRSMGWDPGLGSGASA